MSRIGNLLNSLRAPRVPQATHHRQATPRGRHDPAAFYPSIALAAAFAMFRCGGEDEVCAPIELNSGNTSVYAFNGATANFTVVDGSEVLRLSAQGASDPGVTISTPGQLGWASDCYSSVSFQVRGNIEPLGNWADLYVQLYLDGDSPTIPSIPGNKIPVTGTWSTVVIGIPDGRRVAKIQPLVAADKANVDLWFGDFTIN